MRALIFAPKEEKKLRMAVRAAKLHEYLAKNHIHTVLLPDFNIRKISLAMLANYIKFFKFLITRKSGDFVLFENERSVRLLSLLKILRFRVALDIRDDRALQRQAYKLDAAPEKIDAIKRVLLKNIEMCDYVFTVSQSYKELYPQKYHHKIFLIENASDHFLFQYKALPNEFRVGFLSGIAPGRGIELLINAMNLVKKKVPGATLTIAGSPGIHHQEGINYYNKLKNQFESDWISFRDDVFYSVNSSDFLQGCYLTVIPHPDHIHYQAALPVKLFDSLACGRPVVATDCKETSAILRTYECGMVADFTAEDLADKITQLLLNRDLSTRMGINGRKAIEDIYNWDHMAKKIIDIVGNK